MRSRARYDTAANPSARASPEAARKRRAIAATTSPPIRAPRMDELYTPRHMIEIARQPWDFSKRDIRATLDITQMPAVERAKLRDAMLSLGIDWQVSCEPARGEVKKVTLTISDSEEVDQLQAILANSLALDCSWDINNDSPATAILDINRIPVVEIEAITNAAKILGIPIEKLHIKTEERTWDFLTVTDAKHISTLSKFTNFARNGILGSLATGSKRRTNLLNPNLPMHLLDDPARPLKLAIAEIGQWQTYEVAIGNIATPCTVVNVPDSLTSQVKIRDVVQALSSFGVKAKTQRITDASGKTHTAIFVLGNVARLTVEDIVEQVDSHKSLTNTLWRRTQKTEQFLVSTSGDGKSQSNSRVKPRWHEHSKASDLTL